MRAGDSHPGLLQSFGFVFAMESGADSVIHWLPKTERHPISLAAAIRAAKQLAWAKDLLPDEMEDCVPKQNQKRTHFSRLDYQDIPQ